MKTIACRILDVQKVPYTLHEYQWHENEIDAISVAHKVGLSPGQVFKTLVLRGDRGAVLMACLPGDRELDLKALAGISGNKRVEMVKVEEIQTLTGYLRGGVSPLGTRKKYPFYLDESALHLDPISISAGQRGAQIFLKGSDLARVSAATVAAISK